LQAGHAIHGHSKDRYYKANLRGGIGESRMDRECKNCAFYKEEKCIHWYCENAGKKVKPEMPGCINFFVRVLKFEEE
jgi:hypothetical protein